MKNILLIIVVLWASQTFAQDLCFEPDVSIWENTWQSCQITQSPNVARGNRHWIQYDLGASYEIGETWVWNINAVGQTNRGFRNVVIDYSLDGKTWEELGAMEFERANGEAIYAGFSGLDFEGKAARFVLITGLSNWGDDTCFGLAEVKFNIQKAPAEIPDTSVECNEVPLTEEEIPEAVWCYLEVEYPEHELTLEWAEALVCGSTIVEVFVEMEGGIELFMDSNMLAEYENCESGDCEDIELEVGDLPDYIQCYLDGNHPSFEVNLVIMTVCDGVLVEIYVEQNDEVYLYFGEEEFVQIEADCMTSIAAIKTNFENIKLFPNPAKNQTYLLFESSLATPAEVELVSVNGQVVWRKAFSVKNGSNKFTISLQNISGGLYMIIVQNQHSSVVLTERVVVVE